MALFFLSYRRTDSAGHAGRLTDALEHRFGVDAVFRDVDDIAPGEAFEQIIVERLQQVRAVIVLIGPRWIDAETEGLRRLDRGDDFVRREIELALVSGKLVVPVMIGGATMPEHADLPSSIRDLAGRHAIALNEASWKRDLDKLSEILASAAKTARPGLPRELSRWGRWKIAVVVMLALSVALFSWQALVETDADISAKVAGAWVADVNYPWGVSQTERFELIAVGAGLRGTAEFLGISRDIEEGRVLDGKLQFYTQSWANFGDAAQLPLKHVYLGTYDDERIHFVLHSGSAETGVSRLIFIARRP